MTLVIKAIKKSVSLLQILLVTKLISKIIKNLSKTITRKKIKEIQARTVNAKLSQQKIFSQN